MRQTGFGKLKGTSGDMTYYQQTIKGKKVDLARAKGGVDPEKIKNDPNFQRTRENNAEFGMAGKFAKVIRLAFNAYSKGTQGDLVTILLRLAKQKDTTSARGERSVANVTDFNDLRGFAFNPQARLGEVIIGSKITIGTIDATSFNVNFGAGFFNPPQGATHYKLVVSGAVVDRAENSVLSFLSPTVAPVPTALPAGGAFGAVSVEMSYSTLTGAQMMMCGAGVEFYQEVNGNFYPLNNDAKTPFEFAHYRTA